MKKTSLIPSLFVFIFGSAMSVLILFFLLERQSTNVMVETFKASEEVRNSVQEELLKTKSFLAGVEALFYSGEFITRAEFKIFCKSLVSKNSAIQIVEWQPKVLSKQRKSYELMAQKDGLENFHFFEIDKDGKEVKAIKRDIHFPVFYFYSSKENVSTIGLDVAFSPLRMKSKMESMKTGQIMASETFGVILKNINHRRLGMAFSVAVFNDESIKKTEAISDLKGFLAIVIDLDKIFTPIAQSSEFKNFQFEISDETDSDKVIYSTIEAGKDEVSESTSVRLKLNGRVWKIKVQPTDELYKSGRHYLPWFAFAIIFFLSIAISLYVHMRNLNEDKIRAYERQLEQKQRLESIGLLASGVAHEFNNVLQGILLSNENLKAELGDDPNQNECVDISIDLCYRGRDLVRQILSFARKEAGGDSEILPSEVITSTISLLRRSFGAKIKFKLDIEEDLDRPFMFGVHHLTQIIVNLCNNAAHAISGSGVIEVSYKVFPNYRELIIKDNGRGMTEEVSEKIFDPFFTTKSVDEGTGLGLSIIYGIVKTYKGTIAVASTVGIGTELRITLPEKS